MYSVVSMSKRPSFRLDLGEPLATELDDFCRAHFRGKTQLIRELVSDYLRRQLGDPEVKKRVENAAKEPRGRKR
jgi:hypothetical protein